MTQSFTCKQCGKISKVSGIHHHTKSGDHYVTCEYCYSKNKLAKIPAPLGAPTQLEVVGLVKDDI